MHLDDLGQLGPKAVAKAVEQAFWERGRRGYFERSKGSFSQGTDDQPDQRACVFERDGCGGDADIVMPDAPDDRGDFPVPGHPQVAVRSPDIGEKQPPIEPLVHMSQYRPRRPLPLMER